VSEAEGPVTAWPHYWPELRDGASRVGHFTVSLFDTPVFAVPQAVASTVFREFVMPLHRLAASSYVSDVSAVTEQGVVLARACRRVRGRWTVRSGAIGELLPIVAPADERVPVASLVFDCERPSRGLIDVLANAYDPVVIANLGAVGRGAVRSASRSARTGSTVCVVHGGLGRLSVFAAVDALKRILTEVGRRCRTTARFRKLYGPGGSIQSVSARRAYGTGFHE
jgi:hypothetical protein